MEQFVSEVSWKAADGDPGALEGYLSVFGNVDLQGDVIERGAFKKTAERINTKGIPLLADHDGSISSVLGTITQAREDSHGLKINAAFASTSDAQSVRTKMLEGHVRAMSIGYEPMDWGFRDTDDGRRVRVLKEIKLWEGSVVVFPANEAALVTRVKNAVRRELRNLTGRRDGPEFNLSIAPKDVQELYENLDTEKTAIRSHDTPTSTGDWDGPATVAAIPDDASGPDLRSVFAWVESGGDSAAKSSYKFPHHNGVGGAANVTACRAGIAALNGARGGADIPSADRRGVYNHLAAHLRDADVEPPELRSSAHSDVEPEEKEMTSHQQHEGHSEPAGNEEESLALAVKMFKARSLLNGRDPDEVADPTKQAGLTTRLDLIEQEVTRLRRLHELREQLNERLEHVYEVRKQLDELDK